MTKFHWPKFRMDWLTFVLALLGSTAVLTLIPAHYLVVLITHKMHMLDLLSKHPLLKVWFAAEHSVIFAFTAGLRRKRIMVPDHHLIKQFDTLVQADPRLADPKLVDLQTEQVKQILMDFYMQGVNTERYVFKKWFR